MKYRAHVHDRTNKTVILWLEEVEETQLEELLGSVGKDEKKKPVHSSTEVMLSELGISSKG